MTNLNIKVCFVIETTSQMTEILPNVQSYIKETITTLPSRMQLPSASVLPSAILYRDIEDPDNCVVYPFSTASTFLETFPNLERESSVACFDKSDAVDVAGAIHTVLGLDWSDAVVSLVVHCGITPPHGKMFDDIPDRLDKYPGGDPFGHNLLKDMYMLSLNRVHYMFVRISGRVDTMLECFHQVYQEPGTFTVIDCPTEESELESYISEPDSAGE
jgi:hypothetical protein